jgi:hypothetical protein
VLGACTSPRVAAASCGATAAPGPRGCIALTPCGTGRARDLASGQCLPRGEVRAIALSLGMLVGAGDRLECPADRELAVATGDALRPPALGCVLLLRPAPAARLAACPAGALATLGGSCARVYEAYEKEGRVDVSRWLQVVVGPDGSEGAPPLCDALGRGPAALDPSAPTDVRIAVSLAIPDNDVSLVSAHVGVPLSAALTAEVERFVAPRMEALRSLGGVASQAAVALTVRCSRARPVAATVENDPEN